MFGVKYRYVFIALLSIYSYLNILITVGSELFDIHLPGILLFGVLTSTVLFLWEGNRFIEHKLVSISGFLKSRVHPLIIHFAISMIMVVIAAGLSLTLLYVAIDHPLELNFAHFKLLSAYGFRVNLFLHCINAIVYYMNQLKKTQLEAEQFKKISIEAQFEALRSQINPHFLFNSFNVLSTLVYKDADTASKFISQLSNVYRYLLYTQEKKIVTLEEEVEFIESYLYLLRIRFGENLIVENSIRSQKGKYLAPATLQMLIENAIKHNVVSKKNPLRIRLFSENGSIGVANTLQEKSVKEPSTQIGLRNIQSRYGFLSNKGISIEKGETEFRVLVPLLEIDEK